MASLGSSWRNWVASTANSRLPDAGRTVSRSGRSAGNAGPRLLGRSVSACSSRPGHRREKLRCQGRWRPPDGCRNHQERRTSQDRRLQINPLQGLLAPPGLPASRPLCFSPHSPEGRLFEVWKRDRTDHSAHKPNCARQDIRYSAPRPYPSPALATGLLPPGISRSVTQGLFSTFP